jgi:NADH:ubiquinone oxidoreductase subunit 6 (subunit J)
MGPALAAGFLVPIVLYLGLYVFLNGGIIGRLIDREGRPTFQAFFADCGRYFGRFVRLFLLSLVFYVLAFGLILAFLSSLLKPVLDQARTEWTPFWVTWLRTLVALLLLSLVHMIFDYARIAVVAENDRRVLRALQRALKFIGRRFFRSWLLYLVIGAGFLVGAALFLVVQGRLPDSGLVWLGLGLIWGQAFMVFRLWTKMVFFAAQAEYYRMNPY